MMNGKNWNGWGVSEIGPLHIKENLPNQDSFIVKKFCWGIVGVVCDGLGSKQYSHIGSKALVDAIVKTAQLFDFEKEGIQVVPSARAVNYTMNRRAIRDLASRELGLRTAKYFYAKTFDEFKKAADEIGFPCVVKPLMSSSGHGQSYVHNDDELKAAFNEAMEGSRGDVKEVIIEEFIDFDSEFTLLTVTQKHAPTIFCPPIGHIQKSGDYRESWQPYHISDEALKKAQHMANEVTKALTGYGLWGVEFFMTKKGEVIFSELSPRPHDTGMVTLGHTTNLSEFELHLRAIMGWPIPAIHLEHYG